MNYKYSMENNNTWQPVCRTEMYYYNILKFKKVLKFKQ